MLSIIPEIIPDAQRIIIAVAFSFAVAYIMIGVKDWNFDWGMDVCKFLEIDQMWTDSDLRWWLSFIIISLIIAIPINLIQFYFSITVGHTMKSTMNKIGLSVIVYVVLNIAIQILSIVSTLLFIKIGYPQFDQIGFLDSNGFLDFIKNLGIFMNLESIVLAIIMSVVSIRRLSKCLNLE